MTIAIMIIIILFPPSGATMIVTSGVKPLNYVSIIYWLAICPPEPYAIVREYKVAVS
jgi:hypothetical protein